MRVVGIVIAVLLALWLIGAIIGLVSRVLYIMVLVILRLIILRLVQRR